MTTKPPKTRIMTLRNQTDVVEARWPSIFWAFALDWLVVWLIVALTVVSVSVAADDTGTAVVAGLVALPVGTFVYGLATGHRRSLGQAAAGTRTVRLTDGSVPGVWRAGFVMLNRLIGLPLISVVFVVGALSGDPSFDSWSAHLSIDVRDTEALLRRGAPTPA